MADNIAVTPGSGASLATDDVGGVQYQRVKLDGGGDGAAAPILGDSANGLDVDVTRVSGNVTVVDGGGSLTVDGSVTVVDGGGSITMDSAQLPAALVGGKLSVIDAGLPAALSGLGNLKVAIVEDTVGAAANVVTDKSGFVEGTGKTAVAGAVYNDAISADPSEDQAAALRITAKRGLHVNLRSAAGVEQGTVGAPVRTDPTGTTTQPTLDTNSAAIKAAVELLDDGVATLGSATPAKAMVAAGHDGTNARALSTQTNGHVNIHDGGNVISVDFAGATPPVNVSQVGGNAVATAAAGIPKVGLTDETGAAYTDANPLQVSNSNLHRAIRRTAATYSASQTDIALITPTGGTKLIVESIVLKVSGAGVLQIFANSNAADNMLLEGNFAVDDLIQLVFPNGHPMDAVNEVLRYTTGVGAAGRVTVFGYEV